MKHYIIIGPTLREVIYCFDYMYRLLGDKISRISKLSRTICIDEYYLRFTSEELYFRDGCHGCRYEVINARHVERLLDTYKVLARK